MLQKWSIVISLVVGAATILSSCTNAYYIDKRASSPRFNNGVFDSSMISDKTWWDFLKIRMTYDWADWPDWVESEQGDKPISKVSTDEIQVTLINHSTVLIQSNGFNIITDPIYSDRASPFSFAGPKRVRKAGVLFEDLPKIDVVIISHDHYDHFDLPTIKKLVARDNPQIFLGLGVGQYLSSTENVTELDWWQTAAVSDNFKLTFVPVQHFSGRGLFDRFSTLWGGYVLEIGTKKIYFGGDSGYADHYIKTYERFGAMDLSFLPIGAYAPKEIMEYVHLDPQQAVQAHLDLKSRKSIGIHYGTFQLTAEQIDEPTTLLSEESIKAGLHESEFVAVEFGQTIIF